MFLEIFLVPLMLEICFEDSLLKFLVSLFSKWYAMQEAISGSSLKRITDWTNYFQCRIQL